MTLPAAKITSLTAHGGLVTMGASTVTIGGLPASRIQDMHTCPLFTVPVVTPHVGGLISWGSINVLSCNLNQARMTDLCTCGVPNTVLMGEIFVLVGDAGAFAGPMGPGLLADLVARSCKAYQGEKAPYPYAEMKKDGEIVTEYDKNTTIHGTAEERAKAEKVLNTVRSTENGKKQAARIQGTDHHVDIYPRRPGDKDNETHVKTEDEKKTYYEKGRKPGEGADSVIYFDPDDETVFDGSQPWMNRPSDAGLYHELNHAADNATGTNEKGKQNVPTKMHPGYDSKDIPNDEARAIGIGTYSDPNKGSENDYRRERGLPQRTE